MGKIAIIIALPIIGLLGGGWILSKLSHRADVKKVLDGDTLGQRCQGYDKSVVQRQWDLLSREKLLDKERLFLQLDLAFPLLYGSAYAGSLWMAWAALGRRFNPLWILAPVIIVVLADWTENLLLLGQLHRYPAGLQDGLIQAASIATRAKLQCLYGLGWILGLLVVQMLGTPKTQ
jgi:hypothetical protein